MASKIVSVDADSSCARAGIVAGETLVAIDGASIRDVLDLKFYSCHSRVTLTVERELRTARGARCACARKKVSRWV